jgi:hypothetical protein
MKNQIEFTRINNDTNGNPRYVCHFLNLLTDQEKGFIDLQSNNYISPSLSISERYNVAVRRSNKLGGRKYHTKSYGGGIVFQSYNIQDLENSILELVKA